MSIIDHFGKDMNRGITGTQYKKDDADFTLLVKRVGDKREPLKRVEVFVDKLKDGNDKFKLFFDVRKVVARDFRAVALRRQRTSREAESSKE